MTTNPTPTQQGETLEPEPILLDRNDVLDAVALFCSHFETLGERFKKQLRNTIRTIPRAAVAGPRSQFPQGEWQHVQIKAGNPRVVAIQFKTAEQATEFINTFAANSSPTPAGRICVKCGHSNFNRVQGECDEPDSENIFCGCKCEFASAESTRVEGEQMPPRRIWIRSEEIDDQKPPILSVVLFTEKPSEDSYEFVFVEGIRQ